MTPDEKFRAAVVRWIVEAKYGGEDPGVRDVEINCSQGGCDTCATVEVELVWRTRDRVFVSHELEPWALGRWIGELL